MRKDYFFLNTFLKSFSLKLCKHVLSTTLQYTQYTTNYPFIKLYSFNWTTNAYIFFLSLVNIHVELCTFVC